MFDRTTRVLPALTMGLLAAQLGAQDSVPPSYVAFENVTVVPMDQPGTIANQTVVVQDRRIVAMGPSSSVAVPSGATRIDGSGKYLMPGLAEMHGHAPNPQWPAPLVDRFFELNALNGITAVRSMQGNPLQLQWRDEIGRGERLGPRLFISGTPIHGGTAPNPGVARRMVTEQASAGYDGLKIHMGLSLASFDAMAATARAEGIQFGGHIATAVGLDHALESGIGSVEHIDGVPDALLRDGMPATGDFWWTNSLDNIDRSKIPALARKFAENNVWVAPTQTLWWTSFGPLTADQLIEREGMQYWPTNQVQAWHNAVSQIQSQTPQDVRDRVLALRSEVILALRDAGAGFLLAADAPQVMNVPGFATIQELEAMVEAGLTSFEALQSGTHNAARYLGLENSFGAVREGMRADLVLLNSNPLDNVSNVRDKAGVVINGHWLSAEEIARRLAALSET